MAPVPDCQETTILVFVVVPATSTGADGGAILVVTDRVLLGTEPPLFIAVTITLKGVFDASAVNVAEVAVLDEGVADDPLSV